MSYIYYIIINTLESNADKHQVPLVVLQASSLCSITCCHLANLRWRGFFFKSPDGQPQWQSAKEHVECSWSACPGIFSYDFPRSSWHGMAHGTLSNFCCSAVEKLNLNSSKISLVMSETIVKWNPLMFLRMSNVNSTQMSSNNVLYAYHIIKPPLLIFWHHSATWSCKSASHNVSNNNLAFMITSIFLSQLVTQKLEKQENANNSWIVRKNNHTFYIYISSLESRTPISYPFCFHLLFQYYHIIIAWSHLKLKKRNQVSSLDLGS